MYIAPGNDPEVQCLDLDKAGTTMFFRGVSSYDMAERLAAEFYGKLGKELSAIELCGGFGIEGTARIKKVVDGRVPVGSVKHDTDPLFDDHLGGDEVYGNFRGVSENSAGVAGSNRIPGEKTRVGFIYISEGQDPAEQRGDIHGPGLVFMIRAVSSYAEAENAARELVADGCVMVELCAGFGIEGEFRVKQALGPGIPCGAVKFDYHPSMGFRSGDELG